MRLSALTLVFALGATPSIASAQLELDLWLTRRDAAIQVDSAKANGVKVDPAQQRPFNRGDALAVRVHCAAPLDCTSLTAGLGSDGMNVASARPPTGTAREGLWEFGSALLAERESVVLQVWLGTTEVASVALAAQSPSPASRETRGLPATVAALVTFDCSTRLTAEENATGVAYTPSEDRARFLVGANGNVYRRPDVDVIDEDDIVEVWVVAHPDLLPALRVRRTSEFREPGTVSIVGQDVMLPELPVRRAGRDPTRAPRCERYKVQLGDFQPGRAEITLSAMTDQGDIPTGSFEFGVNTLYIGAFALGAIRSELKDPTFGLAFNGTDSVITTIEDREPRVLYTLTYTPFVWGKRDLEKGEQDPLDVRRFNPIFGLVLSDVTDNFVVGVSYDLFSAVYLSVGWHLGRVRRLNPDAGYDLGDAFTGTRDQIPTTVDWRHDTYVGVSLDLRAATEFIGKALSAPGR